MPATIGYYASVQDAGKTGLLLGPFDSHAEALDSVAIAKAAAEAADPRAFFYAYGTCKITSKPGSCALPAGVLNARVKTSG